ncbi:MAG: hypothetical protein Q8N74_07770, partial [Sulfuricella sp.]|nr:hypothetical protein [Sulfuricella sp.]
MNPDCPLEPKHRCGSGALAAIFGRIRAGGGAPTCTSIPMDNPGLCLEPRGKPGKNAASGWKITQYPYQN